MNMIQAWRHGCDDGARSSVVVMGEDVDYFGGVYASPTCRKWRTSRARLADLRRRLATAIGMAERLSARRIQFADYIYPAVDQTSELAHRYRSGFSSPS
jgi:pyruvate/2-oxoglutarate/acetoin dehydrogenase E1 component